MKTSKLLVAIKDYFGKSKKKQRKKKEHLEETLSKLKRKENALEKKLAVEKKSAVRKSLKKEIAIVHAQRKKGVKFLKGLDKD